MNQGCMACGAGLLNQLGASQSDPYGIKAKNAEYSRDLGWCLRKDLPRTSALFNKTIAADAFDHFVVKWQTDAGFLDKDIDGRLGPNTLTAMIAKFRQFTPLGKQAFDVIRFPAGSNITYPQAAGNCTDSPAPPPAPPKPPKPPVKIITPEFNEVDPIVLPPPEPPPAPPPAPPKPPDAESSGKMWALIALAAGAGLLLLKGKK